MARTEQKNSGTESAASPAGSSSAAVINQGEKILALFVVALPTLGALATGVHAMTFGVSSVDLWLLAAGYVLTVFGTTIGFHRLATHRAFRTHGALAALFYIFGSMSAQGPLLWWAATHRLHHQKSDQAGDPHSPVFKGERRLSAWQGFWHAHSGWFFGHENADWLFFIPDLLKDRVAFAIHRQYFFWVLLGLALPALIGGLLSGTAMGILSGFLWGGLLRVFVVQHVTWAINSLCHMFGDRPLFTRDQSRNNALMIFLALGEGWHNHHHAFPAAASNQFRWWQFDASGLVIQVLGRLGLARDIQAPTPEMLARSRERRLAADAGG
ncbi:MAG: acyl-CoA desaturase [bacterium]|nr:acyl-CoA desaturase [bacterium]